MNANTKYNILKSQSQKTDIIFKQNVNGVATTTLMLIERDGVSRGIILALTFGDKECTIIN